MEGGPERSLGSHPTTWNQCVGRVARGTWEDSSFSVKELSCRKTRTLGVFVGGPHIMHVRGFHVEARLLGQLRVLTKTGDGHPQFIL